MQVRRRTKDRDSTVYPLTAVSWLWFVLGSIATISRVQDLSGKLSQGVGVSTSELARSSAEIFY